MVNVRMKASELVKAGFAFGLGIQLSAMTLALTAGMLKSLVDKSEKMAENDEKTEG